MQGNEWSLRHANAKARWKVYRHDLREKGTAMEGLAEDVVTLTMKLETLSSQLSDALARKKKLDVL